MDKIYRKRLQNTHSKTLSVLLMVNFLDGLPVFGFVGPVGKSMSYQIDYKNGPSASILGSPPVTQVFPSNEYYVAFWLGFTDRINIFLSSYHLQPQKNIYP